MIYQDQNILKLNRLPQVQCLCYITFHVYLWFVILDYSYVSFITICLWVHYDNIRVSLHWFQAPTFILSLRTSAFRDLNALATSRFFKLSFHMFHCIYFFLTVYIWIWGTLVTCYKWTNVNLKKAVKRIFQGFKLIYIIIILFICQLYLQLLVVCGLLSVTCPNPTNCCEYVLQLLLLSLDKFGTIDEWSRMQ